MAGHVFKGKGNVGKSKHIVLKLKL